MQSEDFDKKIKEAAEHHHPAYDEKAWDKMEKKLDKHMPTEKDDRRRVFFFLLLFLAVALTGGGIYYLKTNQTRRNNVSLTNESKNEPLKESAGKAKDLSVKTNTDKSSEKVNVPVADKSTSITPASSAKDKTPGAVDNADPAQKNNLEIKRNDNSIGTGKPGTANSKSNKNFVYKPLSAKGELAANTNHKKTSGTFNSNTRQNLTNTNAAVENNAAGDKEKNSKETTTDKTSSTPGTTNNSIANTDNSKPTITNSGNNLVSDKPASQDPALQKKAADTTKTEEKVNSTAQQKPSPKPGKQKKSAFAITFTAMPDLSMVGVTKAGKVKMGYGAGLSYTYNRFTVRSGFYIGKKVYTAGPDDYHIKYPGWPSNILLDKVDADCKVYEIPLLLSYNFIQSKKSNWFFSTGLSTYIMKRESYDYYYTYTGSSTIHTKTTTINDEYKHFFSILNLSAGYERRINNTLSITAEPYFKVPLDGIGLGKIQLNSAGVALTLSIKPFPPKK